MSIIGYILGLGDRNPSNLMIDRFTGSIIHVDFGECFESTKERILFPEYVPFRLTRFMVKAFGPSGIDGVFRKTALDTVKLVRKKREHIMACLEIFVHAPVVMNKSLSSLSIPPLINQIDNDQSKNVDNEGKRKVEQQSTKMKGNENGKKNELKKLQHMDNSNEQKSNGTVENIISRISDKINGKNFNSDSWFTPEEQVDILIKSATDLYNLSHLYHGWNPLW